MKKPLCALLALLTSATLHGQVIYNTRTAYDLAHPVNAVIDFNNLTPAPTQYNGVTSSTPYGDVSFAAIPSNLNIEFLGNNNFPFLGAGNLALYAFNGQFLTDSLLITLPANSFSFGTDVISPSPTVPEPYQFTVYSGSMVLATIASPSVNNGYTFIGYDSLTSPITSIAVQISNALGNPEPVLDNFTVVPEPGTWFAATLALIGILLRRSSRRAQELRQLLRALTQ
jgi:hypothetical protein